MQEIVGQIIANVAKYPSTKHGYCCVPVVEKHCMRELVEWCCQGDEESWRHDEAVFVHWKVVVDAVEEEVGCDTNAIVR